MQPEKVRFETNVPVEVALRFDDGKEVTGQFGDQVYYSLQDGRAMYVQPIVAERIRQQGIKAFERFSICKREVRNGNRKSIEWQVARVDPPAGSELAKQLEASIEQARQNLTPPPASEAPAAAQQGAANNAPHTADRNTADDAKARTLLQLSLWAAIDAAAGAEEYAKSKNYSLRFTSEDVRAMGLSLYIQGAREGGGRWAN